MKPFTIKDVETAFGITYAEAQHLIAGLVATKTLQVVGKQPSASGRGKGSNIYRVTGGFDDLGGKFFKAFNEETVTEPETE